MASTQSESSVATRIPVFPNIGTLYEEPPSMQFYITRNLKRGTLTKDRPHWHDHIQLWYTAHGNYLHNICERECTVHDGGMVIIPPFVPHNFSMLNEQPLLVFNINFSVEFLEHIGISKQDVTHLLTPIKALTGGSPVLYFDSSARVELDALLNLLFDEYFRDSKKCLVLRRAEIQRLLSLIVDRYRGNTVPTNNIYPDSFTRYYDLVRNALQYISKNYQRKIYVSEICRQVHLSDSHFHTLFKMLTGATLSECLSGIRVKQASSLLTLTDEPIPSIMGECGFRSISHFYEQFQYFIGQPPSAFRQKARVKAQLFRMEQLRQ